MGRRRLYEAHGADTDRSRLVQWLDDVVDDITATRCIDISRPISPDALLRRDGRPVTESVSETFNLLLDALQRNDGNLSQASQALGMAKTTLFDKVKKYGLQ